MPKKILIVEDDKDIRRSMQHLLELEDYQVAIAEHGQAALDLLKTMADLPALIILDLTMPVMDGFEFRDNQEKDPRLSPIPVLLMTADGRLDEKRMRSRSQGALKKPADVDVILSTVKALAR